MFKQKLQEETNLKTSYKFTLPDFNIPELSYSLILKYSPANLDTESKGFFDILPTTIDIDFASFPIRSAGSSEASVEINQDKDKVILSCQCGFSKINLCEHQAQVLMNILNRPDLNIFFNQKHRAEKIKKIAVDYGLQNEQHLDEYFQLQYINKSVEIRPKLKELLPLNKETDNYLRENLIPKNHSNIPGKGSATNTRKILVFSNHKFYNHLYIELFEAQVTLDGKVKNPLTPLDPTELIWKTDKNEELKFYSGISKFQNSFESNSQEGAIEGLKAIIKNPLNLGIYYHDNKASGSINSSSIALMKVCSPQVNLTLSVDQKKIFYEISGKLMMEDRQFDLNELYLRYNYFLAFDNTFFLIENPDFLRVISFFKQNNNIIIIHQSKYEEFRKNILLQLEDKIKINYSYLKPATPQQLEEYGFDQQIEKKIYLSDSEDYVIITPVIKYGNVEVPVLSKKQIYSTDAKGKPFTVERDDESEIQFVATLLKQHPDFEEQLSLNSFYLHKNRFLSDDWFLDVFEEWQNQNIKVLGFNEIKNNKLNPNKPKVSIIVSSGVDWFDTNIDLKYGKQKVSLKHLHKSIRNKIKFVELGDGTQGILPDEWIEKFSRFFQAGEIVKESLRTPRINFTDITDLYDEEVLTEEVKNQVAFYKEKTSSFESIEKVEVPSTLSTSLRQYQKEGLNWLNFLDEFNFGGCLADDMGLGKTVQIIAFILHQRTKKVHNTNLIVVPTSLIFNWESEIRKFAPSIKVLSIYGAERVKDIKLFDDYEVILTSYGTLLSDIRFLKNYRFNYIFLDESQSIKNPESLRYKSVRLLKSRNRIVLTGTPIENNTFDLYGQLSFACPGLLGSKQHFKDHYSMPIDKFKDNKRAKELQRKVNPFILRRTKAQVATELPEKTEMVIYCEMGEEQRNVYDSYSREFYNFLATRKDGDLSRDSINILAGLTKLRQICNSPSLINDNEYYGDNSSKIEVLLEQIESKSEEHKIVIFSQFVGMLDLIKKELQSRNVTFEYLAGQTKNRSYKVNEFQNNKKVRVFLISLKAGGTGLNLTEADYVYLVDPWWNPAVENQAIDRIYRIGQKKNVVAVRLICPDTIEEKILKLQESKRTLAEDLIRTDSGILKSLSREDLLGLFK